MVTCLYTCGLPDTRGGLVVWWGDVVIGGLGSSTRLSSELTHSRRDRAVSRSR